MKRQIEAGRETAQTAALPFLQKRNHVRVFVPPGYQIYALFRPGGTVEGPFRGFVRDISAGGMSIRLMDGSTTALREGLWISGRVDYEGESVAFAGEIVHQSVNEVSLRFDETQGKEGAAASIALLDLMIRIITKKVEYVDRSHLAPSITARLRHKHFYGPGYLDIRVQQEEPAWWQMVFLEYLVSWDSGGLVTGTVERSFTAQTSTLARNIVVMRDATPSLPVLLLATKIVASCQIALGERFANDFGLMFDTLMKGIEPEPVSLERTREGG